MAIVRHWYLLLLLSAAGLCSCDGGRLSVVSSDFGTLSTGEQTTLYTLTNRSGARMTVCDYGARIVSIQVPDRDGVLGDVVVGYGDIASFEKGAERFMGCVIGRYGNRINHASFSIDGQKYELVPNELRDGVPVQCHGGPEGFDRFVWESTPLQEKDRVGVRFQRVSPDGEQGYPGNLNCSVTYWWTEENVCRIEYEATTDRPTVVNLSNHTVFNLKGPGDRYVMNHLMQVESDTYVLAAPMYSLGTMMFAVTYGSSSRSIRWTSGRCAGSIIGWITMPMSSCASPMVCPGVGSSGIGTGRCGRSWTSTLRRAAAES